MNEHQISRFLDGLERLHGTAAEYQGFLSNHGPMALDALVRLGGEDDAREWVDRYRLALELAPAPSGADLSGERWRSHLGVPATEADWVRHFERAISDDGWLATLSTWWPRLLPGAAASAAHGLLRTAHAVRNLADGLDEHPRVVDELAQGLALWTSRFQRLPGAPTLEGPLELAAAAQRIPLLEPHVPSRGPGIGGRLAALSTLDGFATELDQWGAPTGIDRALDDLIALAAGLVLTHSDNPIAYCHVLTAPACVRMILPSIPVEHHRATVSACWQLAGGLIAAFGAQARPSEEPPSSRTVEAPRPDQLAVAAIAHGDEHVLKLTEACIRQFTLTGDDALLRASAAYVERMSPTTAPPAWTQPGTSVGSPPE